MEDICSICLTSPIPPLNLCITNCGHKFCKECLEKWQNLFKKECPMCRVDIKYYMYNNSQIRPIFKTIVNTNNQLVIRNSRLKRSLIITTSVSVTSLLFISFLYYNELFGNRTFGKECI